MNNVTYNKKIHIYDIRGPHEGNRNGSCCRGVTPRVLVVCYRPCTGICHLSLQRGRRWRQPAGKSVTSYHTAQRHTLEKGNIHISLTSHSFIVSETNGTSAGWIGSTEDVPR